MPDNVLSGLVTAAKVSASMPKEVLAQQSFWRCMNNKVYACMVGANLPCQEKADTNKTPSAAMTDFCKANPSASVIPATVTGRATIYDWKCVSGKPEVAKEVFKADARGFIADFWYELAPSAASNPNASMANPASTNCVQNGGKLEIRKDAKGGEVGYCVFADKSECEEWAFMRGECKPGAKPVNVTKADNGKSVSMAMNGVVVVTLDGNATTGYAWALESGNDKVLKAQGDPKYNPLPAAPGMVGTGGAYEFRFNAVGAGTATLKFIHKQPWVQSDPKAETFSVTVNVK
jgi:inhibitor of cysteine peptidase